MPMTDRTQRVLISQITVDRDARQRRVIDTKGLEDSITKFGLIQAIVIDAQYRLHAGERRLTACRNLGHTDILCRFVEDLSPVEAQLIELEENIKRTDLCWQDQARAIEKIHLLYHEIDTDWTETQTGQVLSLSQGNINLYLKVARELDTNEKVAGATGVREAWNIIARRESRNMGNALQELLETTDQVLPGQFDGELFLQVPRMPEPTEEELEQILARGNTSPIVWVPKPVPVEHQQSILNTSFLSWAPQYQGPKFSLVHCDFPYGVDFAAGPQGQGAEPGSIYSDRADVYDELLACLCNNLDRLMSVSGHLMFWCSAEHNIQVKTRQTFARLAPTLEFQKFPLVWTKSDNAGIASDARRNPRHTYEICLLASRGRRQIVKIVSDAYNAPTDKRLHISTKPEPVLKHFMTMLVDENTTMLDPTCGSASSLRAAESLGAKYVLGLEIDSQCCEVASQALRNFRLLRKANQVVDGV